MKVETDRELNANLLNQLDAQGFNIRAMSFDAKTRAAIAALKGQWPFLRFLAV